MIFIQFRCVNFHAAIFFYTQLYYDLVRRLSLLPRDKNTTVEIKSFTIIKVEPELNSDILNLHKDLSKYLMICLLKLQKKYVVCH